MAMLPGGFKKDSRVWLHKNARVYQKKALTTDCYNVQLSDEVYDPTSEDPFLNPSPYITDERGQVFKKDSRTWLHKSSFKKLAKAVTTGVLRVSSTGGKTGSKKRQPRGNANLNGGELGTDLIGTRSSTEMIRKQNHSLKVKKSKMVGLIMEGNFIHTVDSVKEMSTNAHLKKPGASYHNMKTVKSGSCEVSAYASDFCIVEKRKPAIAIDFSSSSSDDDVDDSDEFGPRNNAFKECHIGSQLPVGHIGYNSSNIEITRDGLRELERAMKEQSRSRSERLTLRHTEDSLGGLQHEVSPETLSSGSRVSLEACINLSEELGNENVQAQDSTDPISQSFEHMHLCSPKVVAPAENTRPSGDS